MQSSAEASRVIDSNWIINTEYERERYLWENASSHRGEIRIAQQTVSFLVENYLYYQINKRINRTNLLHITNSFERNDFIRFCLITASNEKISLLEFEKALQVLDSNWIVNPKYKGERW